MIGYMKFSGMFEDPDNEKHRFDIIGEDNGYIALIPFSEMRSLFRRFPRECCSIAQIAANKVLETLS